MKITYVDLEGVRQSFNVAPAKAWKIKTALASLGIRAEIETVQVVDEQPEEILLAA